MSGLLETRLEHYNTCEVEAVLFLVLVAVIDL